jgi:hypothetical protein
MPTTRGKSWLWQTGAAGETCEGWGGTTKVPSGNAGRQQAARTARLARPNPNVPARPRSKGASDDFSFSDFQDFSMTSHTLSASFEQP